MRQEKVAAIFPAFGCKYLGNEREIIGEFSDDWTNLSDRAARHVRFDTGELAACRSGDFKDELQSQYAVYLYSCAVSNLVKRSSIRTDYSAGYSMGLYAALYHAESVTFEQGLDLIHTAYQNIKKATVKLKFGIGVISGLVRSDVSALIAGFADLEIININNKFSFLIAGFEENVRKALSGAREQGALNTRYLAFTMPYHSKFMDDAASGFNKYLQSVKIHDPVCPVVSTIDQRLVTSSAEVIKDMTDNIHRNINWLNTMTRLIGAGVGAFIECGPGKSLYKMAKFIDGAFTVYPADALRELIRSDRVLTGVPATTRGI